MFFFVGLIFVLILCFFLVFLKRSRTVSSNDAYVYAESVPIYTKTSGQITQVFVKNLDSIKKGAVILELDNQREALAVSSAQARLAVAQAQYDSIKSRNLKSTEGISFFQNGENCSQIPYKEEHKNIKCFISCQ